MTESVPSPVEPKAPPTGNPFENPRLYCLMRNDMASLNPGKAVAQGMHAANQVMEMMLTILIDINSGGKDYLHYEPAVAAFQEWRNSAGARKDHHPELNQGFGATICKEVTERQLYQIVDAARRLNLPSGFTHDPSYPLVDGDTTHLLPVNTCGFVFVGSDVGNVLLRQYGLMP